LETSSLRLKNISSSDAFLIFKYKLSIYYKLNMSRIRHTSLLCSKIFSVFYPLWLTETVFTAQRFFNEHFLTALVCVHRLVLETLEPLPADRKCFRMINGVLVERTVKDVIPALKTNSDGLRKVLEDLVKQYNSKQVEMEKWKVYSLGKQRRIRSADIWSTEEE
jgi:hypothetical protein